MASPLGLTIKTKLEDMQVGDCIPCRYTATSGVAGAFSELGTCTASEIPVTSTATPNGLFYFIKVDKGTLIADRVVQHSISWDTLSNAKYIENSDLSEFSKLPDLTSLPTGRTQGVTFSSDGVYVAVSSEISPYIFIYKKDGDTFTRLQNIDILLTGVGRSMSFSADGVYLSIIHDNASNITITMYKRDGDMFTKLPDIPSILPTSVPLGVGFSPNGVYMVITLGTSPFMYIYKRDGDTFTKLPNPDNLPPIYAYCVGFSSDSVYMTVGIQASPFMYIYKRNGDIFTKIANPTSLPTNQVNGISFSNDGFYMAVCHFTSPFMTIYRRSGDIFSKIANPTSLPTGTGKSIKFSSDGDYLYLVTSTAPYIHIYSRNGDTFTKSANPKELPTSTTFDLSVDDNDNIAVTMQYSPYIMFYKRQSYGVIRSLSGGCVYADSNGNLSLTDRSLGAWPINNEWDKYIVNSDLNGKITKGDDNIWNCNRSVRSWTRDTAINSIANNTYRTTRGYTSPIVMNTISNTTMNSINGFRPVLNYIESDIASEVIY